MRPHRSALAVLVATGALLAPAGAASAAAPVRWHNVVSPTKKIRCYQLKYGGPGVECFVAGLPRTSSFGDPIIRLGARGGATYGSRSDFPGYSGRFRTLRYGRTWWTGKGGKIRCTMRSTGLTCRNRAGHGFRAAANATVRF